MIIKTIKLENFRSFKREVAIDFSNLNVFVGENDIGKSTILEALDIFFNDNKGVIKIDKEDINIGSKRVGDTDTKISVVFKDLPLTLTIDSTNNTILSEEYLLNSDGCLEIIKKYSNAGKAKVFIKANHPTNPECLDLLLKKNSDLKKILAGADIKCENKAKNAEIRKSIWGHYSDSLQLKEVEIELTKEDAKNTWDSLQKYLPLYSLFQSDRKNSDGDSEIQDPMKLAVKEILKNTDITKKLNDIAQEVTQKLKDVTDKTLEKLKEMNPDVAKNLTPNIPSLESLKWADVFKNVSITGDDDIPINKRGSGVKRLILLNFFRAEAERRQKEEDTPSIVYAIEEPETSQHPQHQMKLIKAFQELSNTGNTQIILTTHSPAIVKLLDFENIKLIKKDESLDKEVVSINKKDLPYPSLNEVNYLAFFESDAEYHNELYGHIEAKDKLSEFKKDKEKRKYIKFFKGEEAETQITLTEYIRHQIHHPENGKNLQYTSEELQKSISEMRSFIQKNISSN
ncbi:ATP-binding protein [Bathymodiolus thermophilus thioautotrophic gill symbiont]|uniref:ATP/GTP-binding protein n=1 Tax=Bathymodiolus thermophilus thioautotrophic gill symbiont TaxID=2360 RepID=A0A1J5TYB5_9GAMM|nr:ATP-binding protein [Bathymodiolus thermophilus thioautotrophic gill symbiont]OIR25180.1 ATP/GTP-binding protein [Bathymodiolus thermophilus thioautotrophic gill symbiont]